MRLRRGGISRTFALGNVAFAPFGHDMPLAEQELRPAVHHEAEHKPGERCRGRMMMEKMSSFGASLSPVPEGRMTV